MRAVALLLTAILLLSGCGDGYDSGGDRPKAPAPDPFRGLKEEGIDELSRAPIEGFGSVKLPGRAQKLRTYHSSALDTMMLVSFTIDRPGMEQFVADSGFKGGLKTGVKPLGEPEGGQLGWKLGAIKTASGAEDRTAKGVYRRLTVDLTNGDRPVVYLLAYTT
jgi:hypothetical protein